VVVDGTMLAAELRRRRARPRSLADAVADITRPTWVLGDLRTAPMSMVVLAALSLIERPTRTTSEGALPGERRSGEGARVGGNRDRRPAPSHDPR